MSRHIDADALRDRFQNLAYDEWNQGAETTWANAFSEAADIVDDAPTADAVEVVRCKDCKYRPVKEDPNGVNYGFNIIYPDDENEICPCIISDGWYSWMPRDNWFCAYGERKETEDG